MKNNQEIKGKIKHVLFDLDGTLWDTQKHHAFVETELMKNYGVYMLPDDVSTKYAGYPTHLMFKEILQCDDSTATGLVSQKWNKIFPMASCSKQLCDLNMLFSSLKERGILFSIGTASPVRWAHELLHANGLSGWFGGDNVIGGDMVKNGKPSPDIWLMAAGSTPPGECLVVEDGFAGIKGAISAGMYSALILPNKVDGAIQIDSAMDILDFI